jgi:hypothetical protein
MEWSAESHDNFHPVVQFTPGRLVVDTMHNLFVPLEVIHNTDNAFNK